MIDDGLGAGESRPGGRFTTPVFIGVLLVAGAVLAWLLFVALPDRAPRPAANPAAPAATAPAPEGRKIKARLFYVNDRGDKLKGVEQDVPYGEGTVNQARAIIAAQIAPATAPSQSAVPPGTLLKALFITPKGEAYVDFSPEFRAAHPGGSTNEILTIYTIVNVLTTNLPAVTAVQLLVDGKEIDTLAGHVDLRRPLAKNLAWVE